MATAARVRKLADSARSSSSPLKAMLDRGIDAGVGRQPGPDGLQLGIGLDIRLHVGFHVDHARAVDPAHQRQLGLGGALDEVAERDGRAVDRDAKLVKLADVAHFRGEAGDDIDFVVGIVRPVVAEFEAARDELDHVADGGHVETVFRGLGTVDVELPLDAGDRARILHVDQARHGFELLAHDVGGRFQRDEVGRGQLQTRPPCRRPGRRHPWSARSGCRGSARCASRMSSRMVSTLRRLSQSPNSSAIVPITSSASSSPPERPPMSALVTL